MKQFVKKAITLSAVFAAAAGTAILPTATAQAAQQERCPRAYAVCTWTEPSGRGELRVLFNETRRIDPGARSAQNHTNETWCFYDESDFHGRHQREVQRGERVYDFGFRAHSARPGHCWGDDGRDNGGWGDGDWGDDGRGHGGRGDDGRGDDGWGDNGRGDNGWGDNGR
ncbi:peptidase inhibitor family I36 protein [Streptomyces celluloflavus]|uniref:peptidase inhibitor family I36 protein n=1 Tax=Streptomyces celluloflavus TaxID=58344 RepID=UPI00345F90A7|nr:peptidase inhibitor family I36 protein [Streptomyces celluloflavus]